MKKLLGLHCLGDWFNYINHINLWKPPIVNILSPNADQVNEVKRLSPNTIVVGRLYKDDSYYNQQIQNRPIDFAREIDAEIRSKNISSIDYWQTVNEPTPYWDKLDNLRKFTHEQMRLADQAGYKCAILAWSVGNPDLPEHDRLVYWRQFYEVLEYAQRNKHAVMVHQYNKPNLINNIEMDDWLIWRLEKKVLPHLRGLGLGNLKFIIGEIGVDHLIANGHVGGFKESLTDEQYVSQLLQWEQIEQAYAANVLGSCIFTLGTQNPWDSYSISSNSNVISLLSTHYANNANQYDDTVDTYLPHIPNEKEPEKMDVRISDGAKKLGIKIHSMTPQDEWVYRVKDVFTTHDGSWEVNPAKPYGIQQWARDAYLRSPNDPLWEDSFGADHNFFAMALDENGKPIQDLSFLFWSDGADKVKDKNYTSFVKRTPDRASGWVDIPIFNNFIPERGEHGAWAVIPISGKFEYVSGAGMPANNHVSTFVVFQKVKQGANTVPTPDPLFPVETYLPYVPNANSTGSPATVTATVLNVRAEPNANSKIIAQIKSGDKVYYTNKTGDFYKVGANAWVHGGWLKLENPTVPTIPSTVDSKTMTIADFKKFMARILDIDVKIVNAILQIESGNRYYNEFGKPIKRTELHLLKNYINQGVFDRHFRILGPRAWEGHQWRENEQQSWKDVHDSQATEEKVHELAKTLNRQGAFESMSIGAPQILGSNYKMIGYNNAEEMYNDFAASEAAQITAMFDYITDSGGWAALLKNDLRAFIASYNGPGQVEYYLKLFNEYMRR